MVIAKKTPSGLRPDSNSDLTLAVRELIRWCGRGDLIPHAFRRHPLKMVCLPVPPLPHFEAASIIAKGFQYFTMAAKDFGSRLAPPTRAPSISSSDIRALTFSGFTEPPYRMR